MSLEDSVTSTSVHIATTVPQGLKGHAMKRLQQPLPHGTRPATSFAPQAWILSVERRKSLHLREGEPRPLPSRQGDHHVGRPPGSDFSTSTKFRQSPKWLSELREGGNHVLRAHRLVSFAGQHPRGREQLLAPSTQMMLQELRLAKRCKTSLLR